MNPRIRCATPLVAFALAFDVGAKPIAYADGTTVMAEYGASTMVEAQVFYAPHHRYSFGAGHLLLDSDVAETERRITYARLNLLARRWNLPTAQANLFAWGGAGAASTESSRAQRLAWNAGGQADYETRRVYVSLKSDFHYAAGDRGFSNRIDTLQVGLAPYEHEYDELATWLVVQARRYTGGIHDGTETAVLLRVFRRATWLEAGATLDGKLQAMLMFNF
jgi:hypothetical protein